MKQISEIVQDQELTFVNPEDNARVAAKKMTERNIGAVPVLDQGRLIGLFTERDLMTRVVAENRDPDGTTMSEVMTRSLVVASPRDSVVDCLQRMHSVGCRHLPVVDEGRLLGILSLRDLLQIDSQSSRARASFLEELVTHSPDYES